MDINVLSPDQASSLRLFQYKPIQSITDASLNVANENLKGVLNTMEGQNSILQKDVNTLQTLLDTIFLKPTKEDPELIEEIKWNQYYYKKYTYQIHLLWIIIGVCILINLYSSFLSQPMFSAITGLTLAIAFIYIGFRLWDFMLRDNANFDEYNFYEYTGTQNRDDSDDYLPTVDISNCVVRDPLKNYIKL